MSESYSNLFTDENTNGLNGTKTIIFPWPAKRLTVTNDSGTTALEWKFKNSHSWATLGPSETVSMDLSIKQMIVRSVGAKYRIWALG